MYSTSRVTRSGVLLIFLVILSLHANSNVLGALKPYNADVSIAFQQQSLNWSIAGNLSGNNPNILSELKWYNLKGVGLDFNPRWKFGQHWLLSVPFNAGYTINGVVTDSDYEGDNRASRVFYAKVSANTSRSFTSYPQIGYCFDLGRYFKILPAIGYVYSSQQLFLKKEDIINNQLSLNSSYLTHWFGPGASVEAQYVFSDKMSLAMLMSYYQVDYKATANWNLIETLKHPVSFSHRAKGFGYGHNIRLSYKIKESLQLMLKLAYGFWSTGVGEDKLFKTDDSVVRTRLNDVTYQSFSASTGVRFYF